MKSHLMTRVFASWVIAAAAATAVLGVVYVVVQQNYRNGANDPQIEVAENVAQRLEGSAAILDQIPSERVDAAKSLSTFVVIYDTEGNPIAGSGYVNGALLAVPKGVFDAAQTSGENRLTLEPYPGVRIAAVVVPFVGREANGYALAGRSLREVEAREDNLLKLVLLGWAGSLAILLVAAFAAKTLLP